jgi:predicted enzyme related to lactoylglutathione lyase
MKPVTWFNIPSDDLERASNFYNKVFGWELQPLSQEADDNLSYYTALTARSDASYTPQESGRVNGCIVKRSMGLQHPTVLIDVDDLDKALEAVLAAGGKKASEKIDLSSAGGVLQFVEDTEGNVIELWKQIDR